MAVQGLAINCAMGNENCRRFKTLEEIILSHTHTKRVSCVDLLSRVFCPANLLPWEANSMTNSCVVEYNVRARLWKHFSPSFVLWEVVVALDLQSRGNRCVQCQDSYTCQIVYERPMRDNSCMRWCERWETKHRWICPHGFIEVNAHVETAFEELDEVNSAWIVQIKHLERSEQCRFSSCPGRDFLSKDHLDINMCCTCVQLLQ